MSHPDVRFLSALDSLVRTSYANHSRIYAYIEARASLVDMLLFVNANAGQPAYDVFLRQWLELIPPVIQRPFREHLKIEVDEDHAGLARRLVAHATSLVSADRLDRYFDPEKAQLIAYSFAPERTRDRDVGFFLGCFYASELLSATRARQLYRGFRRNGVADEQLTYLKIHSECDLHHGEEVGTDMILPVLAEQPALWTSILEGATDRLARACEHALWFEDRFFREDPAR